MTCPGCGRPFMSVLGMDAHRRHPAAATGCRYRPGERRGAWRPGYLVRVGADHWRTGPARA